MVDFFTAFMSVFLSGQQGSVLFSFAGSKYITLGNRFDLAVIDSKLGMTKACNAANYMFWLEELEPTIQETSENHNKGPKEIQALDVDKVRFSYPMRPDSLVLRGINLKVSRNSPCSFVICLPAL